MESEHLDMLRAEIEKTFNRKILTSADCYQLGIEIAEKTFHKISFNTLRRYFRLMKDQHVPSYYTLDLLAQYCGFSSFHEFIVFKRNQAAAPEDKPDAELLNYLLLLFKNLQPVNIHDVTFYGFVLQTINYLEQHPKVIDDFQRGIAKTENGRNYYFEQFINIDKLTSYYGDGLRYYLNEKKTRSAQIFGHSLLCLRHWLTENDFEVQKHLFQVMKHKIDLTMEPTICARYFATQLLFSEQLELTPKKIILEARQFYLSLPASQYDYSSYFCFEIILCEALILTGHFEEALFYIEEVTTAIKRSIPSYSQVALHEPLFLFKAIVYSKGGHQVKAREIFEKINPQNFHFLSRKYLTTLYLLLNRAIKQKAGVDEQLNYLITGTGFTRLREFWKNTGADDYQKSLR